MTAHNHLRVLSSFTTMATLLLALQGCGGTDSTGTTQRFLCIAVDVSDRSPQRLLAYASAAYRLQRGMNSNDRVRIYEFAHAPELIYEGPPLRGRNLFNRKVASRFASEGALMDRRGTRTDLVLERLLIDVRRESHDLSLVLLTDGGIEDLSSQVHELIHESVAGLQCLPGVRHLLVAGVNQEWRSQWEDWVMPLGSIATVRGLNDMDSLKHEDLWVRSK